MVEKYSIRTDLALEQRERFESDHVEVQGVVLEESYDEEREIRITTVKIETENGAKVMGKPVGTYITLEAPNMAVPDEDYHEEISRELEKFLKNFLKKEKEDAAVLVVGLGNRKVTPDALGPYVVDNLRITRHIMKEYGKYAMGEDHVQMVSAVVPGVMGQTGMETVEIIKGIVKETSPDVVQNLRVTRHLAKEYGSSCLEKESRIIRAIVPGVMAQTGMETLEIIKGVVSETGPDAAVVIDALAARSTRRLNRTIQIADTGINPGSGVGNHRSAITMETIGVPVIAIGVPTVVDAATIVNDTMENLLAALENSEALKGIGLVMQGYSAAEKYELVRELISPHLHGLFVTPKDIDETVKRIGYTISEALNKLFSERTCT